MGPGDAILGPLRQQLDIAGGDRRPRTVCFQMARLTTRTETLPIPIDHQVADLAAGPGGTAPQVTVQDERTADAGAYGHIQPVTVRGPALCAPPAWPGFGPGARRQSAPRPGPWR